MKLSKLVYLCVKNVVHYDDSSFSYENFIENNFDTNTDYAISINNVFTPINEAIARLNDLDRIPYRAITIKTDSNGQVDLSTFEKPVKEVMSVGSRSYGVNYKHCEYRRVGNLLLTSAKNEYVTIEYKVDIPFFDSIDGENDIQLYEYNVYDGLCNYIIEYVSGVLGAVISEDVGNMHVTRAEQYFANIRPVHPSFSQKNIKIVYPIE